ncbi:uncharacterized protein LOC142536533 [Primulina tabacum]|uniref:uncharacterized protein LOC142536533 n=1 Tax=Primulina tabacum TaxID=48773 RepID=UPI003F5A48E2
MDDEITHGEEEMGVALKATNRVIKNMRKRLNPTILGLLEPRVSGSHADEICKKMGFENWLRVEATGFSGGIWIFWQDTINMEVVHTHPQFLLARVKIDNKDPWFLSIVYGSPNATLRKKLWQDLDIEKLNIQGPWCSIRDYNSVITKDEVASRMKTTNHRSGDFTEWIFNQKMIDMGYEGATHTWTRD